jgi:hypothetical protein
MDGVGYAVSIVLAVVFTAAAVAKLGDRSATREGFAALGLPAPAAWIVPGIELGLAVVLVASPSWGATAALAALAGLTTFIVLAIRRGVAAPCNCFGRVGAAPMSWVDVLRNGVLAVGAVVALGATHPTRPAPGAWAVAVAGLIAAIAIVIAGGRRRRVLPAGGHVNRSLGGAHTGETSL